MTLRGSNTILNPTLLPQPQEKKKMLKKFNIQGLTATTPQLAFTSSQIPLKIILTSNAGPLAIKLKG
jgi:hypothetical protein